MTQSLELSLHFLSAHDSSSSFIFLLRAQRYRSPGCRGCAASSGCCFTHTHPGYQIMEVGRALLGWGSGGSSHAPSPSSSSFQLWLW